MDYAASQDVRDRFPDILPEQFSRSVQLVEPDGEVLRGARAVFQTLAYDPSRRWLFRIYESVPGVAPLTEAAYRQIASHRSFFYNVTLLLFGRNVSRLRFDLVQWVFLRLLGIIYLIAFASFGAQARGLIGSHGILPVGLYLARISAFLGADSFKAAPTLFWLRSGDEIVTGVCLAGVIASLLVLFGVFWRIGLLAAFLFYLSLVNAAQEFLSYQWDILLLETGFLALFLGYSQVIVWLFRWLAFRLMFLSGAVKLLSGDPTWRGLTALTFHYQTQPIPTPLAWYAQQLPVWFQKFSCFGVLFIELVIPFLAWTPRRVRHFGATLLILLQVLIILTGNYAFFNWLTLAVILFLYDDAALSRVLPAAVVEFATRGRKPFTPLRVRRVVAWSAALVILTLSTLHFVRTLTGSVPGVATALLAFSAPYGISSSYGLFASMTTTRPEIVIEGSSDGSDWKPYDFRYKAGALERRPPWVEPHQPRLDWQMWFAALGTYQENVWFLNLLARLLQGTPEVVALLETNPFPNQPPALIRGRLYEYHFTGWEEGRQSGRWWSRQAKGLYLPPVSLGNLSVLPILQPNAATGPAPAR